MCGICGVYEYASRRPVDRQIVETMLRVIHHRGPDEGGVCMDGELALGMRRLSIIDVAGGKQPISNEDGGISIVFNGEIYNFRELRNELQQRGHIFTTASDTEVVV